jgi:hypothetical protein
MNPNNITIICSVEMLDHLNKNNIIWQLIFAELQLVYSKGYVMEEEKKRLQYNGVHLRFLR